VGPPALRTFNSIYVIFAHECGDNVNRPKFIDLFCGIGGMRLAFESVGAQCIFSSDCFGNGRFAGRLTAPRLRKKYEFSDNWDSLTYESQQLLAKFIHVPPVELLAKEEFPEGKTRDAIVKARVNQSFFRSAVLAAYDCRCCVTGLAVPELLTASHIVPWSIDTKNGTNPRNGLCLNAIHDRAFDSGLVTVTPDYRIVVSGVLKRSLKAEDLLSGTLLLDYEGLAITLPERFVPDQEFLRYHNEHRFKRD
jgi:hypothetical protein